MSYILDIYKTVNITLNKEIKFQKIVGFGGAITGAVVHNLNLLPQDIVDNIYKLVK